MSHASKSPLRRALWACAVVASLSVASLFAASAGQAQETPTVTDYAIAQFGNPPEVPTGPLSDDLQAAIQSVFIDSMKHNNWGPDQLAALDVMTRSGDPRVVWLISDLLRFVSAPELGGILGGVASKLLGTELDARNYWGSVTDHLIAWDIPAPPDYLASKRAIFTTVVPGWERIFVEGDIDWRLVSWGGVLIDERGHDETDQRCNCIPAADNPQVASAQQTTWLAESDVVFGIEVNGAYRAYPRQIMEVREMVNDTLGGRDLGIPYCTLCGAAQAYFTDGLPEGVERPILRTSGLLIRSNKVMYDLTTYSVFETFLGKAVTGPLAEKGVQLEQATVITTTWGEWRAAHPETTALVQGLALGRNPNFRTGRDANGPIFPVGDVDPRLPVHEDIIGVVTSSGTPVAFQRTAAVLALLDGAEVRVENVRLQLDGGGVRAVDLDGSDLGSHQAFWFAWSQFHPKTALWKG